MSTRHAFNTRKVDIERGPKGFGFALRRPQLQPGDQDSHLVEPVYEFGAQVRSVEDQGPARKGGLEKDEFVTTINKDVVRGKSYLQVMTMIQGTGRVLSLEVAGPSQVSEDSQMGVQTIVGASHDHAMEESTAEKENQAVVQFHLSPSESVITTSSPIASASPWRHSKELDAPAPVASSSSSSTSATVVVPARTTALYTDAQRFRIIREFEQCARDHSGEEEEEETPFRRIPRLPSQQQQPAGRSPVMPKTSLALAPPAAAPGLCAGAKAFGLTRSTGHLHEAAAALDEDPAPGTRPMVTFKKAYVSPVPGSVGVEPPTVHYTVRGPSTSSVGGVGAAGGGAAQRRTSLGVAGPHEEAAARGGRYLHYLSAAEPRINFKKRKSGNSTGGIGANYPSTSSVGTGSAAGVSVSIRAHSVTNLPAGEAMASGGAAGQRLAAGRPQQARVGSPPSALMHSPLRRGSSPARSAAPPAPTPTPAAASAASAVAAPLSGVEEFDNSIPTSPAVSPPASSATSVLHETRFSMLPEKVVTSYRTGPAAGAWVRHRPSPAGDEVEGGVTASTRHGLVGTSSPASAAGSRLWSTSATASSFPSSLNSAIVSPPHSTSLHHLQPQQQQAMETASSVSSVSSSSSTITTSTTSTTINIRSGCRTMNQSARIQFMMSQPTPAPPLPLPFSSPATPTTLSTSQSTAVDSSSVLRRESYINAVKTRTTTLLSPDAIEEGEEQDDGANSAIEDGSHVDGPNSNLEKAKRFFGESWNRRSTRNKTPKVRDALATPSSNASEKKFYLSVKVVREDGKEARSKSWKSFSLTIEKDVMYLIRERKESSASSSSSAEDMSPIPLRYCHFEWTAPDQSRKKYLVCRMYITPPSLPFESASSTALSASGASSTGVAALSSSPQQAPHPFIGMPPVASSTSLHGSSPPTTTDPLPVAPGAGVSEYKLQFSNPEEMNAFYSCLPESSATVSVIGGQPDHTATYPPPSKLGKKVSKGTMPAKPKRDPFDMELVSTTSSFPSFAETELPMLGSHPPSGKTKLLAFVKNIRWKSSSTESSTTTTSSYTQKLVRTDELYAARMKSMSPDDLGRPLPGTTFGVPLMQVPRSSYSPYVPLVVELCTRIVEGCGLHCVGVYRVSPKKAVIDALEAELNECGSQLDLIDRSNERWNDVHAVSGLLKCFLRKMPDPVFPFGLYNQFLEASERRLSHERRMLLLQRLLALMDGVSPDHPEYKHHRETLKYLAQHLHRVASHSHINKMTTKNLVSMIAPNVFRPPGDTNAALLMQATTQGANILELIVHYHEWFFSTEMDAGCEVPAPLAAETGPSISDSCGGDHEGEMSSSSGGPSTDEALGGAEDRGPQNRGPDIHFRAGEKATDILAAVLDAAMACQAEVSPECAGSQLDEGGFDEVDIDAAVRRRHQQDEAAAAAAGLGVTVSMTSSATALSGSSSLVNSSISVPISSHLGENAPSVTATPATPAASSSNSSSNASNDS